MICGSGDLSLLPARWFGAFLGSCLFRKVEGREYMHAILSRKSSVAWRAEILTEYIVCQSIPIRNVCRFYGKFPTFRISKRKDDIVQPASWFTALTMQFPEIKILVCFDLYRYSMSSILWPWKNENSSHSYSFRGIEKAEKGLSFGTPAQVDTQ